MNFQTVSPIENSKQLMNFAFGKAREKAELSESTSGFEKDFVKKIRRKESLKLDIIKDILVSRLEKVLREMPQTMKMNSFYLELITLTLDFPKYKQSCGAVNWALQKIRRFHQEYMSKINRGRELRMVQNLSKSFYGRVSSTLKQIDVNLKYLEECRKKMRTYPDIKDLFTVCIYGFPNVGKTTLLNLLAGTKAKVANYAFTTTSINAGYLELKTKNNANDGPSKESNKIQLLDVPGTLARKEKMNNIELQAELVLRELAKIIIFVFDPSPECEFSLEKQRALLERIKATLGESKPILVYVSKTELASPETLAKITEKYYSLEELKEKIFEIAKA